MQSVASVDTIPQSTISIVFMCCPQADGKNVSLAKAVGTVLQSSGVDPNRSLSDDFNTNLKSIRELHANFLAFIEERAPMLKVFSVQEGSYTYDSDGKYVATPPMLEDTVISLNHRYECFKNSHKRFDGMPNVQYTSDFTVREACWEANGVPFGCQGQQVKQEASDIRGPSI